jgi:TonB family protein
MDGTVQLNCRTREARMVAIRVVDAQGKPADALVGDARAPTPWRALADTRDDAYLFMVLCGAAAGPQMYEPSAPPPGAFVTFDDYPARALREGREGIVGFRAAFDASGAVVGCEIIASSGHADLDEETCRLVRRRGRFTPAPAGTGLRYYESRVRWQIP